MRAFVGPLLVHGGLVAAGLGVLRALGVIPGLRSWRTLAAGGLAYLVGVSVTLTVSILVLVLGGPFTLSVFAVIAALAAAPLLIWPLRRRRADAQPALRALRLPDDWPAIAILVAVGALALLGLLTLGNRPLGVLDIDGWNQWTRKALLMFDGSHLPTAIFGFSGDFRVQAHYNINPGYPILLPLFEALHFRALNRGDPSASHIPLWLLQIAFIWAAAFIASRVTRPLIWAPLLGAALLITQLPLQTGYADMPLGFFLGLGTLQMGMWLRSRRRQDLALSALLLAAAAGTKNDGTIGAVIVLGVALVMVVVSRQRRGMRDLMVAGGLLLLVAVLPWQVWIAAHHLQTEDPVGHVLGPVYLIDHMGRVWPTLGALTTQLAVPSRVTLFAQLALVVIIVCLAERRERLIAGFYLAVGLIYYASLVWALWASTLPIHFHLRTAADRVVAALGFLGLAAFLQLCGGRGGHEFEPAVKS